MEAAIDTWYHIIEEGQTKYGYSSEFPFDKLDNIILSPHRANSGENPYRWKPVFENIHKYLKGDKNFINVVDLEKEY